jgi:hypothetical protein
MTSAARMLALTLVAACQFSPGRAPIDADATDAVTDAAVDVQLIDACSNCPANDVPGGAEQITGTTVLMPMLTNAHDDAAPSCGGAGGRDLFYELVVPAQQVVYVDTEASTVDGVIAIHAGPCTTAAAEIACSNNPCDTYLFAQFAGTLAPGTYCMIVDEGSTTAGSKLVIDVHFAGRDGTQLTGASPIVVSGDTCAGSDVTDPNCENTANNPGTAKDDMYWYTQCPGTHTVTASTCDATNYDSIVYVRNRGGVGFCIDDGCATGDGSLTTGAFTGAGFLQVSVDGWDGACGTYTLSVTLN